MEAVAPRSTGLPTLGKYLVPLILFLLAEFSVQLSFVFILVIFAAALVIITLRGCPAPSLASSKRST